MCDGIGVGGGDCFSGDAFGGAYGCYNTPMNTVGVGDLVPAGIDKLGNDFRQMGIFFNQQGKKNKKQNFQNRRKPASAPKTQPFVSRGSNSGYDMSPKPLFVPYNPRKK